jgi:hypothetical protein
MTPEKNPRAVAKRARMLRVSLRPRRSRELWGWLGSRGTSSDPATDGDFEQRRFAVQALIVLCFVSGVAALATVVSTKLLAPDRAGLLVVAGVDISGAAIAFFLRRAPWGRHVLLILVLPALATFA